MRLDSAYCCSLCACLCQQPPSGLSCSALYQCKPPLNGAVQFTSQQHPSSVPCHPQRLHHLNHTHASVPANLCLCQMLCRAKQCIQCSPANPQARARCPPAGGPPSRCPHRPQRLSACCEWLPRAPPALVRGVCNCACVCGCGKQDAAPCNVLVVVGRRRYA